jgi:hypothetical protein
MSAMIRGRPPGRQGVYPRSRKELVAVRPWSARFAADRVWLLIGVQPVENPGELIEHVRVQDVR